MGGHAGTEREADQHERCRLAPVRRPTGETDGAGHGLRQGPVALGVLADRRLWTQVRAVHHQHRRSLLGQGLRQGPPVTSSHEVSGHVDDEWRVVTLATHVGIEPQLRRRIRPAAGRVDEDL